MLLGHRKLAAVADSERKRRGVVDLERRKLARGVRAMGFYLIGGTRRPKIVGPPTPASHTYTGIRDTARKATITLPKAQAKA